MSIRDCKEEIMRKSLNFVAIFCALAMSQIALPASAWIQDTGVITEMYVSASGSVAVKLTGGFPNAVADGQCPSYNGWAGVASTVDPNMKASLLMAKISESPVVLTISGCQGAWMKIVDMYVK